MSDNCSFEILTYVIQVMYGYVSVYMACYLETDVFWQHDSR